MPSTCLPGKCRNWKNTADCSPRITKKQRASIGAEPRRVHLLCQRKARLLHDLQIACIGRSLELLSSLWWMPGTLWIAWFVVCAYRIQNKNLDQKKDIRKSIWDVTYMVNHSPLLWYDNDLYHLFIDQIASPLADGPYRDRLPTRWHFHGQRTGIYQELRILSWRYAICI